MGQALKDIPETGQEEKRQRGPIPLNAIFLVLGLFLVFLFYYAPVFWHDVLGR